MVAEITLEKDGLPNQPNANMSAGEVVAQWLRKFGGEYLKADVADQEADGLLAALEECGFVQANAPHGSLLEKYRLAEGSAIALAAKRDTLQRQLDALNAAFDPRRWTIEINDAWHRALPNTHKAFADLHAAAIEASGAK